MSKRPSIFSLADHGAGIATDTESHGATIEPATLASGTSEGGNSEGGNSETGRIDPVTGKRKYRKRNSASTGGQEALSVNGVAGILLSSHAMLAMLLKTQELNLDEGEAKELSKALVDVSNHYGFAPSSKAVAWTNLIMVCGTVYGTRFLVIRNNRVQARRERFNAANEKKQEQAPEPQTKMYQHFGENEFAFAQ